MLATSAREYLALPAGGEISVKFDVRCWRRGHYYQGRHSKSETEGTDSTHSSDSAKNSGVTVDATTPGGGSFLDEGWGGAAGRLAGMPRPQGFLELHKL